MRIWKCPECGKGKRAPERMQSEDTRRYCLECSATTGKMVERVCPALEREKRKKAAAAQRKRERKAQAQAEAAARRAQQERERWIVGDVDLQVWVDRIQALPLPLALESRPRITRRNKRKGTRVRVQWTYSSSSATSSAYYDVRLSVGTCGENALAALIWGMSCGYTGRHWDNIQTVYHALLDRDLDVLSLPKKKRFRALVQGVRAYFERQRAASVVGVDEDRLRRMAELGDAEACRQLRVLERRHGY